jgi:hypothetical protein
MIVPAFGGFGVEASMRKDVAADRTHINTTTSGNVWRVEMG